MDEATESRPCPTEWQPTSGSETGDLLWLEMTRSQAAVVFIWNADKWWHNDVRLV